ncbi:hypothetical protein HaLaN_15165, partial [Haematococcus lacustris]
DDGVREAIHRLDLRQGSFRELCHDFAAVTNSQATLDEGVGYHAVVIASNSCTIASSDAGKQAGGPAQRAARQMVAKHTEQLDKLDDKVNKADVKFEKQCETVDVKFDKVDANTNTRNKYEDAGIFAGGAVFVATVGPFAMNAWQRSLAALMRLQKPPAKLQKRSTRLLLAAIAVVSVGGAYAGWVGMKLHTDNTPPQGGDVSLPLH